MKFKIAGDINLQGLYGKSDYSALWNWLLSMHIASILTKTFKMSS